MDGLFWKTEWKKEPIAYGIFKIVIGATVEDEKVSTDLVQEKIQEFEDDVQSVDILCFNKLWLYRQQHEHLLKLWIFTFNLLSIK